jgi:predicted 3-demethylubiquinone-9 3-methyltransferase (glyoxalase superfamily)
MQNVTPCLWFDDQAEEAANFYVSIFRDAKLGEVNRYAASAEEVSNKPAGSVLTVEFEVEGQKFIALNGGPIFKFTEAISFMIKRETQEELDELSSKLSAGGEIQPCGWVVDKFGVAWQIIPSVLEKMMHDKDSERYERVTAALMEMKQIDIGLLQKAYMG